MDATVGIITRTKDRPVLLKRALESVINQTFDDWMLVVVNDGGAREPVDALVEAYHPKARGTISVIHNSHSLGMEAASNKGIRSIRTQFLAIHDDDDSWAPEYLTISVSEQRQIRSQFPQVAGSISMANAIFEKIDGNIVTIERTEAYNPSLNHGFVPLGETFVRNQFAPIQLLFRYDAAEEIGFFRADLPVLGDWDFAIRFLSHYDIYIIPQVLAFYHHRVGDKSVYGNSILAGRSQHKKYAQLLKNEWLRRDLTSNSFGVGTLLSLRVAIQNIQDEVNGIRMQIDKGSSNHAGIYQKHVGRDRRPIANSLQLVRYWLRSGKQAHYMKQAFRSLRTEGPGATLRKIKLWLMLRRAG